MGTWPRRPRRRRAHAMADLRPELARRVTTPVMFGCYDGLGKKKNDRMFHINLAKRPPIVAWKKITDRKGKEMHMVDVRDGPAMPDAHQLFAMTDEDGSGFLSEAEVAGLYRRTMGENLRKKKLAEDEAKNAEEGTIAKVATHEAMH